MKKIISITFLAAAMLVSCGSQKSIIGGGTASTDIKVSNSVAEQQKYIAKVFDNASKAENIVAKIDCTIDAMGNDVSVDGKLQMRRDQMIRITLSPLGLMEVGRLEFTPEGVLVVDRIHKQYCRATYNDLDFLKNNGLDFYALQAIFWNELFIPGTHSLTADALKQFGADLASPERQVTYSKDRFAFAWTTIPQSALISALNVEYGKGTANASTASCQYGAFKTVDGKQFPSTETLTFSSEGAGIKKMSLSITMKKITTDSSWDTESTVSSKYKQVTAEEIFRSLKM